MKKRIKLGCWNCKREYSLYKHLNPDEQPKLFVECPFCEQEGVVDLAPYRTDIVDVFQAPEQRDVTVGETLDLPSVLPTSKPEE